MLRKRILLSYAKLKNKKVVTSRKNIFDAAESSGLDYSDIVTIFNEFLDRNIIREVDDRHTILVKFFDKWLTNFGVDEIITSFSNDERIIEYRKIEEEARVKTAEIKKLLVNWGPYKGKSISIEEFRAWNNQFETVFHQRMAFTLADNIKLYTNVEIDSILSSLYKKISASIRQRIGKRIIYAGTKTGKQLKKEKRKNLVVSYLDGPGKSGAEYAKKFADCNNILSKMVVEQKEVHTLLLDEDNKIDALIFIDDFIGTGKSLVSNFKSFYKNNEVIFQDQNLLVHIATIAGFHDSKAYVESQLTELYSSVWVHTEDLLGEADKIFSDKSKRFNNYGEKENIRVMSSIYGGKLSSKYPNGYGDCQSLIVFPYTCPNNTLPIFWKETNNWIPLFKRDTN